MVLVVNETLLCECFFLCAFQIHRQAAYFDIFGFTKIAMNLRFEVQIYFLQPTYFLQIQNRTRWHILTYIGFFSFQYFTIV